MKFYSGNDSIYNLIDGAMEKIKKRLKSRLLLTTLCDVQNILLLNRKVGILYEEKRKE